MSRIVITSLAMAVGFVVFSTTDVSAQSYGTRYGNADTRVAIGVIGSRVYIVEERVSDGSCTTQAISEHTSLDSTVVFDAGGGSSKIRAVADGERSYLCGYSIGGIPRDTPNFVAILAGAGNDLVYSSRRSAASGDGGDDVIVGEFVPGASGGPGNDWIVATGNYGESVFLNGEDGDDHICDLADGSAIAGGQGYDYYWNTNTPNATNDAQIPDSSDCSAVATWAMIALSF